MPLAHHPAAVRVRVPAKVNLHLGVGQRRPDGFHELVNVFCAVAMYDEITATAADELTATTHGEQAAAVPDGPGNLAWQAAQQLAAHAGIPAGVHVTIHKAIPVAGGMAGGSADAAGTLLACSTLWRLDLDRAELVALAAQLGSDVAFPLVGGTAVGTGRGELLTPIPTAGPLHWVFAPADFGISTAAAFGELDRLRAAGTAPPPLAGTDELFAALDSGDVHRVASALGNDLQPASLALAPALRDTLDAGLALGALAAIVAGSGPTCAFLCADSEEADRLATALAGTQVCRGALAAIGPVAGARVVA